MFWNMKPRQLIWDFIQEKIISLFIYEPTDLINFCFVEVVGGGFIAANSHFIAIDKSKAVQEREWTFVEESGGRDEKASEQSFVVVRVVSRREDWKKKEEDNSLGAPTYPWLPKDCMKNTHTLPGRCAECDEQALYLDSNACICTANAHAWMCQYAPARTIWKNTRLVRAMKHKQEYFCKSASATVKCVPPQATLERTTLKK